MSREQRTIAGIHSVRTALKHGASEVSGLWYDGNRHDKRLKEVLVLARKAGVPVHDTSKDELDRLSSESNHQGVVARVLAPASLGEEALRALLDTVDGPPLVLVLDGIQDPHNLGACLRTADAAGVHAVVTPKDRAVGLTPVACKVASGAAEEVPFVQVTNLARTLRWLRDEYRMWVVGTAGETADALYQADLTGPLAIILGAEGKGMRRLTREQCDLLVSIPMAGTVESLNVSVAAGVVLFEAVRQRQQ